MSLEQQGRAEYCNPETCPWTEAHVAKLEEILDRNLDYIRLRHGLPIPDRTGLAETSTPTETSTQPKEKP